MSPETSGHVKPRRAWWYLTATALLVAFGIGWTPADDPGMGRSGAARENRAPVFRSGGPTSPASPTTVEPATVAEPVVRTLSVRGDDAEPRQPPKATPTPVGSVRTYRVAPGDTLSEIADRHGVDTLTVALANDLSNPDQLAVGRELTILPISGRLHVVREGETLIELAERYRVIPEAIAAVNGLADSDRIAIGQQLIIPISPEALRAALAAPLRVLRPTTYRVATGDSLNAIAARFGIAAETLRWANKLDNPNALAIDQEIVVPPVDGILHQVGEGDSVVDIAARYGASMAEIVQVNGLSDANLLQLGQMLVVPGGRPPAPPVARVVPPAPAPAQRPAPAQAPAAPPQAQAPAAPAQPAPAPAASAPAPAAAPAPAPGGSSRGSQIVAIARQYLGSRYVWGGASPQRGFDCSGLIMYVYRQAGIPVPRDLWGQLQYGPRIARNDLQPGDIVFFQNTYTAGLSHNGIYVGGGKFLHAASEATGVIISDLNSAYWTVRFVGATRPGA